MSTIHATRGATFTKRLIYASDPEGTTPINLTGYTVTFKTIINGTTTTYTTSNGLTVTPLAGQIDISIDEAVTALWARSGTYQLHLLSPGGDLVIAKGKLEV